MRLSVQHSRISGLPLDGQIKLRKSQRLAVCSVIFLSNVDTSNLLTFTAKVGTLCAPR